MHLPHNRAFDKSDPLSDRTSADAQRPILHIGVDIDDILYPWYDLAHHASNLAGITNGVTPSTWKPYLEYGCTVDDWHDVLAKVTLDRSLYMRRPISGAPKALRRLREAGHKVHLVTARGHLAHGDVIKMQTIEWLEAYGVPHDTLTFSKDKRVVRTDFFIDDNVDNVKALTNAGVKAFFVNRPWNAHYEHPHRVSHVREFVDIVLGEAA